MSRKRPLVLIAAVALLVALLAIGATLGTGAQKSTSKAPAEWTLPNRDLFNHRVADSQISSSNVGDLEVAWTRDLTASALYGAFASMPIIADGTVYLQDLASNVSAVDLATGATQVDPHLRRGRDRPQRADPQGRDPLRRHRLLGLRARPRRRHRALAHPAGHRGADHQRPPGARRAALRRHDHPGGRRAGLRPRRPHRRDPVDLQHPEGPVRDPGRQPGGRRLEHPADRPGATSTSAPATPTPRRASCSRTPRRCSTPTAS